ncbi:MAG: acetoacetate decarboxylase family protein [Acidimicrobiales bacterium]
MQISAGSDLYGSLPRQYRSVRWLSAYCRSPKDNVAAGLPEPLELLDDGGATVQIEFFVAHYADTPYGPYIEAGAIAPCRYGGIEGQTYLPFLYLDKVGPIVGGRELMGFPKKDGDVQFAQEDDVVRGHVTRGGVELMRFEANLEDVMEFDFEPLPAGPRLLVREFPRADGPGCAFREILRKEADPDSVVRVSKQVRCSLAIGGTPDDPLDMLEPVEVLGGRYRELDFALKYATVLEASTLCPTM